MFLFGIVVVAVLHGVRLSGRGRVSCFEIVVVDVLLWSFRVVVYPFNVFADFKLFAITSE